MSDVNAFNILGSRIEYTIEEIDIYKLKYFPGNPRVYTALKKVVDEDPDQEQIQEVMFKEENVRELLIRIKKAGGLVDEIVVRRDTMEVVEGNSRLAAHRILAKQSSGIGWNTIRCRVVKTLSDKQIRSLLSEYHIYGKADWTTYEQANMFYVDNVLKKINIAELHADTGLGEKEIKKKIEIIKMMEDNDDNQSKHYSHYEQLLTKRSLKKEFHENGKFKGRVLRDIKKGSIGTAQDVRDKLSVVCENKRSSAFKKYVKDESDLEEAYDLAVDSGAGDASIKKLKKFRDWITEPVVRNNLINQKETKKVDFEIGKIQTALTKMKKDIDKKKEI